MASEDVKTESLQIENEVFLVRRGIATVGNIRMAEKGLAFRSKESRKVEPVYKSDMKYCSAIRAARGWRLRFTNKSGSFTIFEGFTTDDLAQIEEYAKKHYGLQIQRQPVSIKGWNWGDYEIDGTLMSFQVDQATAFEIPLNAVSSAVSQKHEVTIEFQQDENAETTDQLVESMRFLVIPEPNASNTAAVELVDRIKEKADITQIAGEAICKFELSCAVPRGRYEIEFYALSFRLHGKTYDHKVFYENVKRVHSLPRGDGRLYFMLTLDPPIRQGSTRYSQLVFETTELLSEDDTRNLKQVEINLNAGNARSLLPGYADSEESEDGIVTHEGAMNEILEKLFKQLTKRHVVSLGSFEPSSGAAIRCSYKANEGFLFPLERALLFLHKPVIYIAYADLANIEFDRNTSIAMRGFDIAVNLSSGHSHEFRNLPKEDSSALRAFLGERGVHIHGSAEPAPRPTIGGGDFGSSNEEGSESDATFDGDLEEEKMEAQESGSEEDSDSEELETEVSGDELAALQGKEVKREAASDEEEEEEEEEAEAQAASETSKSKSAKHSSSSSAAKPAKKRAKKDPNAPKKAKSSYLLWSSSAEARADIKKDNPDAAPKDVMKLLGEKWKTMDSDDKKEWEDKAAEDQKRYQEELEEYKKTVPAIKEEASSPGKPATKTKKKKLQDKNAPKPALTAYRVFSDENRAKIKEDNPDLSFGDLNKKLGEAWAALSNDEKVPFTEKAAKDKLRYKREMESYKPPADDKVQTKLTKPKTKKLTKTKPKSEPSSASKGTFKSADTVLSSDSSDNE